ncbi:hypothetical protein PAPYR_2328 [Paratrimastix pyriformis]|uniref:Secreted protein n=1 Tax=Paratrimastix pyriformis TaxID=342808 RepID=A0ABQ8UQ45_9EUKA|nr:hypothetical protein PAPYR_2328 [Paratrimastix pyriformis]
MPALLVVLLFALFGLSAATTVDVKKSSAASFFKTATAPTAPSVQTTGQATQYVTVGTPRATIYPCHNHNFGQARHDPDHHCDHHRRVHHRDVQAHRRGTPGKSLLSNEHNIHLDTSRLHDGWFCPCDHQACNDNSHNGNSHNNHETRNDNNFFIRCLCTCGFYCHGVSLVGPPELFPDDFEELEQHVDPSQRNDGIFGHRHAQHSHNSGVLFATGGCGICSNHIHHHFFCSHNQDFPCIHDHGGQDAIHFDHHCHCHCHCRHFNHNSGDQNRLYNHLPVTA